MKPTPMERYLYRGVNPELHRANNGKLVPKAIGVDFKDFIYFDGESYFGDGSVFGQSEINSVIKHQRDSSKYPTAGVSTTPLMEIAKHYATHGGKFSAGYVYIIDTDKLSEYNVLAYIVEEHATVPQEFDDKEIILVASNFGVLPPEIIFAIIKV